MTNTNQFSFAPKSEVQYELRQNHIDVTKVRSTKVRSLLRLGSSSSTCQHSKQKKQSPSNQKEN